MNFVVSSLLRFYVVNLLPIARHPFWAGKQAQIMFDAFFDQFLCSRHKNPI